MTQENKDLLLKDICSRIPYGVRVDYMGKIYDVLGISHERLILCKPFMSRTLEYCPLVEEVKPYLFPLSSMTPEQRTSYNFLYNSGHRSFTGLIDFYHKNHLDWRGLIPKGSAIDCTNLNIY